LHLKTGSRPVLPIFELGARIPMQIPIRQQMNHAGALVDDGNRVRIRIIGAVGLQYLHR
jgi:hypothetical protein